MITSYPPPGYGLDIVTIRVTKHSMQCVCVCVCVID